MLKHMPGDNTIKGEINWSIANYGTIVNKKLLNFFGVNAETKKSKIKIKYKDSEIECSIFHVKGNTYQLRWDGSVITKDLKIDFGADKTTFNNNVQSSYVIFEKDGSSIILKYVKKTSDSSSLNDFDEKSIEEDIEEALLEMSDIFKKYLKLFIDRSRISNPDLSQIQIPTELLQISQRLGISFKTSFGMGNPTRIPWLACFYPNQSASVYGVYPVILYRKDNDSLTINYGVSATSSSASGDWPKSWPAEMVTGLQHFPDQKYRESFVLKTYENNQLDQIEDMYLSFASVISDFISLKKNGPAVKETQASQMTLADIIRVACQDFAKANLVMNDAIVLRYVASLLTKRFVILTGLSGSGKTKLAHTVASWLCASPEQYRLVAVGADWTSNENVLGYQDALQTAIYRKPASGALDLILRAKNDPEHPYLLILDEMNLSHVERYFADILSSIESDQQIALHSEATPLRAFENDPLPVPAKIYLPQNLFIIGTVNIDETTYMFSPKVLDRANVIEFRTTGDEISAFLESPAKVDMDVLAGKGAGYGSAFVSAARSDVSLPQLSAGDGAAAAAELKLRLTELFAELAPIGAEFGFRTAFEVSRFFYHHAVLTGDVWKFKDALDAQVVQKLMPKLHGSDRKLRPTLLKLQTFCETHDLPLSSAKTKRMLERLTQDGFTSFAEA